MLVVVCLILVFENVVWGWCEPEFYMKLLVLGIFPCLGVNLLGFSGFGILILMSVCSGIEFGRLDFGNVLFCDLW